MSSNARNVPRSTLSTRMFCAVATSNPVGVERTVAQFGGVTIPCIALYHWMCTSPRVGVPIRIWT